MAHTVFSMPQTVSQDLARSLDDAEREFDVLAGLERDTEQSLDEVENQILALRRRSEMLNKRLAYVRSALDVLRREEGFADRLADSVVVACHRNGDSKIVMIRAFRARSGFGLADSKNAVEAALDRLR